MELHPAWAFQGADQNFNDPTSIRPLQAANKVYSGYGASKFRPLLTSLG
jgi:hypothetical protein